MNLRSLICKTLDQWIPRVLEKVTAIHARQVSVKYTHILWCWPLLYDPECLKESPSFLLPQWQHKTQGQPVAWISLVTNSSLGRAQSTRQREPRGERSPRPVEADRKGAVSPSEETGGGDEGNLSRSFPVLRIHAWPGLEAVCSLFHSATFQTCKV